MEASLVEVWDATRRGAVRAAIWGQNRKPGEYSMLDVLGLTS